MKQQIIDHLLIIETKGEDLVRQGKDRMVILHRQQVIDARGDPIKAVLALTQRTMAIPAGVRTRFGMSAGATDVNMPAGLEGAAGADRLDDLALPGGHSMAFQITISILLEDFPEPG